LGIRIHLLKARRDFNLKNIVYNFNVILKIRKLLLHEKIDITHGHEFFSTVFSRIASVLAGGKIRYITLHNVYYWWNADVHKFQKLLSYITTKVICNSKATMNYSKKFDKINPEKYVLIYNGIDCEKFKPQQIEKQKLLNEFFKGQQKKICLSVGSISHRKGFEHLIEAASTLKDKFPDLNFLIAGDRHHNEEDEYEKIKNLIDAKNLNDRVFITGNRNDVHLLLNSCDIFLMPSVAEGFGLALAEAMSSQCICIASDIEPFQEIIDNGVNGYLFKSKDSESLAEKITMILNKDKRELEKISVNARKKIEENFSSGKMMKQYEALYEFKTFSK